MSWSMRGESVIGISPGGGGYGSPLEREPLRVKHDVDEGYVTKERAEGVYGVALGESGAIDEAETARRRAKLGAAGKV